MRKKDLNNTEIIKNASEILNWPLQSLLSAEDLRTLKSLTGKSVTHTHDYIHKQCVKHAGKPKVNIKNVFKFIRPGKKI